MSHRLFLILAGFILASCLVSASGSVLKDTDNYYMGLSNQYFQFTCGSNDTDAFIYYVREYTSSLDGLLGITYSVNDPAVKMDSVDASRFDSRAFGWLIPENMSQGLYRYSAVCNQTGYTAIVEFEVQSQESGDTGVYESVTTFMSSLWGKTGGRAVKRITTLSGLTTLVTGIISGVGGAISEGGYMIKVLLTLPFYLLGGAFTVLLWFRDYFILLFIFIEAFICVMCLQKSRDGWDMINNFIHTNVSFIAGFVGFSMDITEFVLSWTIGILRKVSPA